jgi:hypothetical protein
MNDQDARNSTNVRRLTPAARSIPNPFRAGTMKARCFERFLCGGDSKTLVADFRAMGAAGNTARTWLSVFRVYVRGVRVAKQEVRDERDD